MDNNYSLISSGAVPEDIQVLRSVTVGLDTISDFYSKYYLNEYIKDGGSKIKFITGKRGAGKSHLLSLLRADAEDAGFIVVPLSAATFKLNDITLLYKTLIAILDIESLTRRLAQKVAEELGCPDYREGYLLECLLTKTNNIALARQEIRSVLRKYFSGNPYMDRNFANVLECIIAERLGMAKSTDEERSLMISWLHGETIKARLLRSVGLAPYSIKKQNARSMLSSISEMVHLAGYSGFFVTIDDLDFLMSTSPINEVKYTRMQRDDAYENIRQLIDDIDCNRFVMYVFAFDQSMVDDDAKGLKSYQALWARIQNLMTGQRLNLFSDMINLDDANQQLYTQEAVVEMSKRLASLVSSSDIQVHAVTEEEADNLIEKAKFGDTSLPLLINRATFKLSRRNNDV